MPLKEEMLMALKSDGWTKAALFKMNLFDDALKESQRPKPTERLVPGTSNYFYPAASMLRASPGNTTLPDVTFIPADYIISVSTHAMRDTSVYPDPFTWDGYRFLHQREQPGQELSAQLAASYNDA
ncbi:hypothetical protein G6011_00934 [Alternaria panax]|uniref:Uncharacterized protein n=1 Tax=Alternaria panax TaxID=48097 RepID=A0AAD4IJ69_9PLEO|nr:hypothetical protein G6011_00934 [Alternaria panax]